MRVDSEKRHLKRYCPMSPEQLDLCMGEACKWSVGGECAIALLARGVADAIGGDKDGGGRPEGTEVDQ